MLRLKQTLHNFYTQTLKNTPTDRIDLQSLGVVPKLQFRRTWETAIKPEVVPDYASVDNSDVYPKFVVSDRSILMRLAELLVNIAEQVWNVRVSHVVGWQVRRVQP